MREKFLTDAQIDDLHRVVLEKTGVDIIVDVCTDDSGDIGYEFRWKHGDTCCPGCGAITGIWYSRPYNEIVRDVMHAIESLDLAGVFEVNLDLRNFSPFQYDEILDDEPEEDVSEVVYSRRGYWDYE